MHFRIFYAKIFVKMTNLYTPASIAPSEHFVRHSLDPTRDISTHQAPKMQQWNGWYLLAVVASSPVEIASERRLPQEDIRRQASTTATAPTSANDLRPSRSNRGYPFSTAGVPILREATAADGTEQAQGLNYEPLASASASLDNFLLSELTSNERDSSGARSSGRASIPSTTEIIPPLRTQIVYRYYPRQKVRSVSSGSIPFMLIGPNVEHWKVTCQQLSARGFHVIAVGPRDEFTLDEHSRNEGPGIVLQLLDSLKWNQVVLVGCDRESILAIAAAMQLAPHRVVGLILCGKLQESEELLSSDSGGSRPASRSPHAKASSLELDRFLHHGLRCPFTIVWDGNTERTWVPSLLSDDTVENVASSGGGGSLQRHRTIIIGGGTAPHRRRPEIFAWVLTRFVEEKIAPPVLHATPLTARRHSSTHRSLGSAGTTTASAPPYTRNDTSLPHLWTPSSWLPIPWRVDEMFNEESMVVFGRIAATALFYGITLRVLFYQYDNVRGCCDMFAGALGNIFSGLKRRVSKLWSAVLFLRHLPQLFQRRQSDGDDTATLQSIPSHVDQTNSTAVNEDLAPTNPDKAPSSPEPLPRNDVVRPFFFLDHVVA
jgi:hypothetical protein